MSNLMAERAASAAGLLDGLRVVEVGHGLAAPLAGMMLAEQGAEVIRFTDPAEEEKDPVLEAVLGRGKLEIALEDGVGQRTLRALIAASDVVLQGEAPGGKKPALDFDDVRESDNPGLISCRIAGFPDFDPRSKLPGHEAIAGTAGFLYNKPLGKPCLHDFPIPSVTAGLYAATSVMAALIARLRDGRGQHVDTSLFQASMAAQVLQIFVKAGVPRGFLALKMVGSPFMRSWKCKDGRYVYLHITLPGHNARMLELLESIGFESEVAELRGIMSQATLRDPSQVASIGEAKRIKAVYERIFLAREADEWEATLGRDLCCIKVRTIGEWLSDSSDAGMSDACTVSDPLFGPMTVPGPLVSCAQTSVLVRARRVGAGGDLETVLQRWARTPSPHRAVLPETDPESHPPGNNPARAPLDGVRVVDLSRIIAGPCAARVLAELGADVVSIQSPTSLDWALCFHLIFNAGKRSVTLDLTRGQGKETLWQLLEHLQPDVLIQNYRHLEIAKRVGVSPERVMRRFPGLTYTHLNAYGNEGEWQDRPGFEQVVQAVSGIQVSYSQAHRPKLLPSPIIDIGCGLLGAFGSLLGLYRSKTTGKGALFSGHLTSVSVLMQLPAIAALQRENCLQHARGRGLPVAQAERKRVVSALIPVRGGCACIAGPAEALHDWLTSIGLIAPDTPLEKEKLHEMLAALPRRSTAHWTERIRAAGLESTVAIIEHPRIKRLLSEIPLLDPRPVPIVRRRNYPGSSQPLCFVGNPTRLSRTELVDVVPPPMRGAHTRELFSAIGRDVDAAGGVVPYPPSKPFLLWLATLARWGYFAWKSGNI